MSFLRVDHIAGLPAARRRLALMGLMALAVLAATACAVQESNTYPIEIFSEMHYSQAYRAQEPPRLEAPASAVVFADNGGPQQVLNVPERETRPYDAQAAGELFAVNCSVCHGVGGLGDGNAAAHLKSDKSYWNSTTGVSYLAPPDLVAIRSNRSEQALFAVIENGILVMPTFGKMLSEEEIWDIVAYIKDESTGLGTSR